MQIAGTDTTATARAINVVIESRSWASAGALLSGDLGQSCLYGRPASTRMACTLASGSGTIRHVGLVDDVQDAAEWMAGALSSSGYDASFTAVSLWEIDRFFDEHAPNGQPRPGGLLAEEVGQRLFGLGAYVGEVVRRSRGGEWEGDDSDPEAEINVALLLADDSRVWPVQRVMKRFSNGSDDSIAAYGLALGLSVGGRPEPVSPKRRWFGR